MAELLKKLLNKLLDYAFLAIGFSLLLGPGVSLTARVGLCWVAITGLMACVGTKLLRTYDTVDELTFYASYHSHPMNQLVHIVCVPLLLFTVFVFAAYVPPPIKALRGIRADDQLWDQSNLLTWPLLGASAWSLHHVRAAPLVGSLVSCLTFAMALKATAMVNHERREYQKPRQGGKVRIIATGQEATVYRRRIDDDGTILKQVHYAIPPSRFWRRPRRRCAQRPDHIEKERDVFEWYRPSELLVLGQTSWYKGSAARYAGVIHIFCWYMQLHPGHGVYEGRKPALLDSVLQAFLDAPLFVWYEVAFACGYDPSLKQQLDAAVQARHAAWDL